MRRPRARGLRALAALSLAACLSAPAAARERAAAAYPLACSYVRVELDRHPGCARRAGELVRLSPAHAGRLRYRRGLAEVAIDGIGWLWVRRDGLGLPVFPLDNGPDPFAQGLVRARHAGRIAFYDTRLRLALATPYDWSHPFNPHGEALVCTGCRSDGRAPASMVGGRWGLIDRRGGIRVPLSEDGSAARRYFAGIGDP